MPPCTKPRQSNLLCKHKLLSINIGAYNFPTTPKLMITYRTVQLLQLNNPNNNPSRKRCVESNSKSKEVRQPQKHSEAAL